MIDTDATTRIAIALEIAGQMSDTEFNAFVTAEKTRRDATAKPFEVKDRVRFVASTRPKKLAYAPGEITERKFYGGEWSYKVRLDNGLGHYVRVKRASLEAI